MASADTTEANAAKRNEPEAETPTIAPAGAEKKDEPDAKRAKADRPAAAGTEEPKAEGAKEPDAKRAKIAKPAEPKTVCKQVEYYLSDENLRHDKFFHEKISADEGGWLVMSLILSCNKMKVMNATKEDVVKALEGSKLELKEDGMAVRRPGNAPLPALQAKPIHHQKKSTLHAHDGGALLVFKSVPAELNWTQIKEKLKEKLPQKATVWWASEVNDKGECFVSASPFEGDQAWFKELELEVGDAKLKCELCYDAVLQKVLGMLPKHIKDKRDNNARKRAKERNRPIVIGNQHFVNVGALKGKVKEIMNSRSDGEQLKPDGTDFKLIKALMEFHPKGAEKSAGLTGIKVARSPFQESRCFYMIKGDAAEDVSMMKCIAAVEQNPPYAKVPEKEKKVDKGKEEKVVAAPSSAAGGTPTEAATPASSAAAGGTPTEAAKPAAETGASKLVESATPADKSAAEEKPAEEKRAEEKPAEEKPSEEKPAEKKTAEEKPVEERPVEEKPPMEKPAEEKPVEEITAAAEPEKA